MSLAWEMMILDWRTQTGAYSPRGQSRPSAAEACMAPRWAGLDALRALAAETPDPEITQLKTLAEEINEKLRELQALIESIESAP